MNGRSRRRSLVLAATISALAATALAGAATARSAPPGPTGPLDHFLCYTGTAVPSTSVPGFTPPASVRLRNQFNPEFFPARVRAFTLHCNPAQKTLPTGEVFPIRNRSWHLGCWSILPGTSAKVFRVKVTNQFGTAVLDTRVPNQLCLPSLKSEKTPPTFTRPAPGEVRPDHVTCYPVAYVDGQPRFTPPASVRLRDQFTPRGAVYGVKIGVPTQLCLPTSKSVPGAQPTPITNATAHLLCFAVSGTNPATLPRTVYDRNQFGTGAVRVTGDRTRLCLPSLKTIVTT